MGADIHMVVEVRRNGKWTWEPDAVACGDCDGKKVLGDGRACLCTRSYRTNKAGRAHGYEARNYDVFGVLANVRNGTWGEETPFIAEPRGLPADRDVACDEGYVGDHSLSYLTLAELLAFDWKQPIHRNALVSWGLFAKWDRVSTPSGYCAGSSGALISQNEATALLASGGAPAGYSMVRVTWTETIADAAGSFCSDFIPALLNLGAPEDVRIVFGFDS